MALIKCPECGTEISDKAESCPNCGYPIADILQEKSKKAMGDRSDNYIVETESDSLDASETSKPEKIHITHKGRIFLFVVLGLSLCVAMIKGQEESNQDYLEENSAVVTQMPEETSEPVWSSKVDEEQKDDEEEGAAEPDVQIDYDGFSEEEYKAACVEMWHDDIFFAKEDLSGKIVKLELFLEERKYFKMEAMYNQSTKDFIDTHNLQRELWVCGVKRGPDNTTYVGGQLYLYFPEDCGYSASDFKGGDHLTFYGEIIDFSTNTWDGYNSCGIKAKYIVNNGQ